MRTVTTRIADPGALIQVLRRFVEVTGSQRAAAEELGVTRPYVTRMLQGRVGKAIGAGVRRRMLRQLHPVTGLLGHGPQVPLEERLRNAAALDAFRRAIISPEGMARVNTYETWLTREIKKRDHVRSLLQKLRRTRVYDSYFTSFESKMGKRGFGPDDPRVLLAELRAVEPLLDAQVSGGIELSEDELRSKDRLRAYLDAALKREIVLLDRLPLPRRLDLTPV